LSKLQLTYAGRVYDINRPLFEGIVQPEGVELNWIPIKPDEFIWRLFRNNEFDVAETSLSSYTMAKTKGRDLIAIPIFPYRRLRFGYIFCKSDSKMKSANDLKGKRMGLLQYQITAAVFMRAFLNHEFGVKPVDIIWKTQKPEPVPFTPPPNISVGQISEEKSLEKMLLDDDVDAFFSPDP
jgi:4,5-dihydroxyphthalate decarboxylase